VDLCCCLRKTRTLHSCWSGLCWQPCMAESVRVRLFGGMEGSQAYQASGKKQSLWCLLNGTRRHHLDDHLIREKPRCCKGVNINLLLARLSGLLPRPP
jgi:hypothetical protein